MFTRDQINRIQPGTKLARSIDGKVFSPPEEVLSLHAKANDIHGKLFVCGYTRFGGDAQMSFSIKEGDETDARIYRIVEE